MNIHIPDIMFLTVTLQGRWEWYLCSLQVWKLRLKIVKAAHLIRGGTSVQVFWIPVHGSCHHVTPQTQGDRGDVLLPTSAPWEASLCPCCPTGRALTLHPLLGKVPPFLTAELSSCSRARGEFSLLLKSFLCVIHWFLNSTMAELLKVLIWGLWICQRSAALSPSVFRTLWETDT